MFTDSLSNLIPKAFPITVSGCYPFDPGILTKEVSYSYLSQTEASGDYSSAASEYEGIESIFYEGVPYQGKDTKHFAYIGIPDVPKGEKVPGVVLVHGGNGTAFDKWVKIWKDKGYAAIAMDLNGCVPIGGSPVKHEWGGKSNDQYKIYQPKEDVWMYHAVIAAVYANNILRSLPEVDSDKIGITGVSWGGVVTSTTLGVDNRFAFAAPVYGCGFLYESETYMSENMTYEKKAWDASNFIKRSTVPTLWVNGNKDPHFAITSFSKSAALMGDAATISIHPSLGHSYEPAWSVEEIYAFADSIVNGKDKLLKIGDVTYSDDVASVNAECFGDVTVDKAILYYNTNEELPWPASSGATPNITWLTVNESTENNGTFTFTVPEEAKRFYISFTDSNGMISSSKLVTVE